MLLFFALFLVCTGGMAVSALRHRSTRFWKAGALVSLLLSLVCLCLIINDARSVILMASLVLLASAAVLAVAFLIAKIRKKDGRRIGYGAALCGLAGIVLFCAGAGMNTSMTLILAGLTLILVVLALIIILIAGRLLHHPFRKLRFALPVCLAAAILCFVISEKAAQAERKKAYEEHELHEIEIQTDYDFEVTDGETPIEIFYYYESDMICQVCDEQYLDRMYDYEDITPEDCRNAIRENEAIPQTFKTYFIDFVDRIETKYPDIPLQMLYRNMLTLKVEELEHWDYVMKSMNPSSLGCYRIDENAIYIPKGTVYKEGEFGYQVLIHEFCHTARSCWFEGDKKYRARFQNDGDVLLEEAMNSVFSCSLLSYEERDIAYQVASNYLRIMLECMDNYELSDYVRHGNTWFYSKLDEAAGYTNYSQVIWKLITLQRSDWEKDTIDIDKEEYYPIYDFLCRLYYSRYITEDMTDEEARAVADELVDKAFYDSPDNYKTDPDRFYDQLEVYLEANQDQAQ